jgi:hypothetical protein
MTTLSLKTNVVVLFLLGIGVALSPLWEFLSPAKRVAGVYRFTAPGIVPTELKGILTAGPASVESGPGFELAILFPDTALSAGNYRGGVIDLWAGRDLVPGAYFVAVPKELNIPGPDSVTITLASQGGYSWIADSGSLDISQSGDSLHGDFRVWLSPRCSGCEAERTLRSVGRGSFSYPKR